MRSRLKSSCFAPRTAWLHETTFYASPSSTPAAATSVEEDLDHIRVYMRIAAAAARPGAGSPAAACEEDEEAEAMAAAPWLRRTLPGTRRQRLTAALMKATSSRCSTNVVPV